MATISTSIELYDRVSAPIYKMLGALDNLTSAFESVETSMDGGFDASQIEAARRATEQAAMDVVRLGESIENNEQQQTEFNRSVQAGTASMNGLVGKVVSLVGAYASIQSIKKIMDVSDELTQTTARIDMMNDGLQTTPELMDLIYRSAQNARGSFTDMAAVVAKFGNNAGDAFGSSEEVVAFANLIQKQMTIAGASTAEASNAMLQLSQALGSGTLRGDELNSIFEQAPNLIQSIADYLDVPIGQIRAMAQEGKLSADIVKSAIFAATDEINAQFEQIPMTWGQVWTTMKNGALMQFQPVLEKVNELANNEQFQQMASNAIGALATVSMYLLDIMEFAGMIASFFNDNWSIIEPIIWGIVAALGAYLAVMTITNVINGISALVEGVRAAALAMSTGATFAATAAQYGFNAALLACPLTWIILLIIAVVAAIYGIIAAINKVTGSTLSATGVIVGALTTAVAFIWNLFLGLVDYILACVNYLVNPWIAFANFFGNLFNDPIGSIIHLFGDMADRILGILESIAKAIDKVFGSNLASAVQGWRSGLDSNIEALANKHGNGSYEKIMDNLNLSSDSLGLKRWAYSDAYNTGYSWGEGAEESVSNLFGDGLNMSNLFDGGGYDAGQIPSNIADVAENTDSMKDSLDITSEDLKYLRDIAETEIVNRFTTAEIKVEMTNNNNISSEMDLDGVVEYLVIGVDEAMVKAAEGVHD